MIEIIHKTAELVDQILGFQSKKANTDYRPFTFLVCKNVEAGTLVLNVMTKCMILISSDQNIDDFWNNDFAIRNWFSVPIDNDDKQLCLQIRQFGNILASSNKYITNYCIFTTTDCNARCFYCYELGIKKVHMSKETAEKFVQFAIKHYDGKHLSIRWFGGEPLFNRVVINYISRRLSENGIAFSSHMISNAYLFNKEVIETARDIWNLKAVQITIDGTRDVYNKTKNYIYKDKDAFSRVISNIEHLSMAGIKVRIRINLDKHNINDIYNLVDFLCVKFSGNSNISVYAIKLYEDIDNGIVRTAKEREKIYECIDNVHKKLFSKGLISHSGRIGNNIKLNSCLSDNYQYLIILPSGKIGKCEHSQNKDFCGDLDSGIVNYDNYFKFFEEEPDLPECSECAFYPNCIRMKNCYKDKFCDEHMKRERLNNLYYRMCNTYEDYLTDKDIKETEDDGTELQC